MNDTPSRQSHHRHLELARAQVIELLSRQAVERELVSRSGEGPERSAKQDVVALLVARQHQAALEQRLAHFHPADIAFVLESLEPEPRDLAWSLVRPERRGAVLLETVDGVRRALVSHMPADEVADVVRPLDPEDIADLVGSLPEESRRAVLERLDQADLAEVRSVLSFPEDSVGSAMDLDFVSVREDASLEAVQRLLRRRKELPSHTNELIVVDRGNHLRGFLPISALLLGEPEATVAEQMSRDPVFFYTDDRMQEAVTAFEKYDLVSAPVVNLHEQVVGRITVDAVVDEIAGRAQTEGLRKVGLSGEDEDLFAPIRHAARRRWPWLAINLGTAFLASRVIGAFEHTISALVALAALMPIVASIGGNSGNQSVALVIRGLAMNQLGPAQLRRILVRELGIASINGLVWGAALGLVTLVLYGDPRLAVVIAAALLLNLLVAGLVGVCAPATLHRFGRDPVMGSSIMLTATTDSMGFLIFLGLAATFLV
uniref:Magnesium transporter MgtE n=1 Tax=uncultured bacterium 16 TaxID=1748268 RepID=A0A0U3T2G4_9BACT|nr:magnesium transporter [uncultured bacterium 16]